MRAFLFDSASARPLTGGALLLGGAPGARAPAQSAPDVAAGEIVETAQKHEQNF